MPHVILAGDIELRSVFSTFSKNRIEKLGWIIKLDKCFLSDGGKTLLLDCTAVRSGFSQDFYLRVEDKGTVTVRVDPYMRIERNEGVQLAVAVVGEWVRSTTQASVEKTNLPSHIVEVLQ